MNQISSNQLDSLNAYKSSSKYYNLNIDYQEDVLADWIIVTFTATTTGLLFFHMVGASTVEVPRIPAAIFSASLVLLGLGYNIFSLRDYIIRSSWMIEEADDNDFAKKSIKENLYVYGILAFFVTLIQIGIVFIILKTAIPTLDNNFFYKFKKYKK